MSPRSRQWWARRLPAIVVVLVVFALVAAIVVRVPTTPPSPSVSSSAFTKGSGLCSGASIVYRLVVDAPTEVATTSPAQNTHAWRGYSIWVNLVVESQDRCNVYGDYVGLRHADLGLAVYDETQAFVEGESWIAGQDTRLVSATGLYGFRHDFVNSVQPDGGKLLLTFAAEWNPVQGNRLNVSLQFAILDGLAQDHVGDRLRFALTIDLTVSETICVRGCWSPWSNEHTVNDVERHATVVLL